ncbi:MAG: ABC transporter ATP-binding protein [Phycisphaerae bacterium]|nr:ABC transporter ATP-binding protein [Phycisphaerae bacterium]
MTDFKHFAKQMLQWRGRFILALLLAAFSALGLGVGLLSLGPALALILDPENGKNLLLLATEQNAGGHWFQIPEWIMDVLPEGRFDGVVFILVAVGCLTVVGGIANFFHQYLSAWIAVHVVARVRQGAFTHVLSMPLGKVQQLGSSEFVSRIIRDAEALQVGLMVLMGKSVSQLTKGIAAFIVACIFDYRLVVIAVIVFPVLAITLHKIGKRVSRGTKESLFAQQELLRISSESIQGLRAVKVNTAEKSSVDAFNKENSNVIRAELKVRFMRALGSPLMEMLAILVLGTLAAIAARSIIDGSLAFDSFLLSIGSLAVAGGSLRPLAGLVTEIQAAQAPAERLLTLLEAPCEESRSLPDVPRHTKSISFEKVTFTYENGEFPAVDDVSVTINHGQRVAIVGPNGSGKTTLVSLLSRLAQPQAGKICIDGVNILNKNVHSLRSQMGVVTQETVLFKDTVEANIQFGCTATKDEVEQVAKQAHADTFIDQLESGYDTIVFEQGTSLSGGQRQRLAIARALLRQPSILIFDEATSQIDAESEAMIGDTLKKYCDGRTVLVIAHRMSTVQNADRILVLDQGRLVGDGTHDELLMSCNVYQRLTETQLVNTHHDA